MEEAPAAAPELRLFLADAAIRRRYEGRDARALLDYLATRCVIIEGVKTADGEPHPVESALAANVQVLLNLCEKMQSGEMSAPGEMTNEHIQSLSQAALHLVLFTMRRSGTVTRLTEMVKQINQHRNPTVLLDDHQTRNDELNAFLEQRKRKAQDELERPDARRQRRSDEPPLSDRQYFEQVDSQVTGALDILEGEKGKVAPSFSTYITKDALEDERLLAANVVRAAPPPSLLPRHPARRSPPALAPSLAQASPLPLTGLEKVLILKPLILKEVATFLKTAVMVEKEVGLGESFAVVEMGEVGIALFDTLSAASKDEVRGEAVISWHKKFLEVLPGTDKKLEYITLGKEGLADESSAKQAKQTLKYLHYYFSHMQHLLQRASFEQSHQAITNAEDNVWQLYGRWEAEKDGKFKDLTLTKAAEAKRVWDAVGFRHGA